MLTGELAGELLDGELEAAVGVDRRSQRLTLQRVHESDHRSRR